MMTHIRTEIEKRCDALPIGGKGKVEEYHLQKGGGGNRLKDYNTSVYNALHDLIKEKHLRNIRKGTLVLIFVIHSSMRNCTQSMNHGQNRVKKVCGYGVLDSPKFSKPLSDVR